MWSIFKIARKYSWFSEKTGNSYSSYSSRKSPSYFIDSWTDPPRFLYGDEWNRDAAVSTDGPPISADTSASAGASAMTSPGVLKVGVKECVGFCCYCDVRD